MFQCGRVGHVKNNCKVNEIFFNNLTTNEELKYQLIEFIHNRNP